jgi:RNA polymerase sigma-70 factor (ECF subfamily)
VTPPADDPKKKDAAVATSDGVALLPSQVTSATLSYNATGAGWPSADVRARVTGAELSDDELVLAVQNGDKKVGRLLYSRLVRVIDATLTRVLGPGQPDHDDWVQAAFEEVVRTIYKGQFQGRCRLTSWAASIACHIGLNAIRSRKTERGIFNRDEDVSDSNLRHARRDTVRALEARDDLRQLRRALSTLSPGRAEAVLLHDALGYDLAEVARMTSSSEAAVQSRLVRGRRDLQERLSLAGPRGKGA